MELTINILIYVHAFFGGLGLVTGLISVWSKKGSAPHKKAGKIFTSIVTSSLISLFVARMPGHENLFLFLIGVFTLYMVLAGNRALTFKSKIKLKAGIVDYLISGTMLLTSAIMIVIGTLGIIQKTDNSVLYIFFGGFGLLLTSNDFKTFRTFTKNKDARLKSHLGRMIGALIASMTAFMIAGLNIGTLFIWILPSILGTGYILFWSRKLKLEKAAV
jgi:uncharacterized membrane protein